MDTLEKSMLDDNKEKNIVDLLRELKYQMHFDLSGHQPSSTIEGSEDYDPRIEICDAVPTYITDIYKLLADMNAKLNNLMVVMASDGTNVDKNKLITSVDVTYDSSTHGFDVDFTYDTTPVKGLNTRIEELNASIGTGNDEGQNKESLQSRITKMQESIGNSTDTENTTTVIGKLIDIKKKLADENKTLGGQIAESVGVLVARMDDMNGRIGTPGDSWQSNTLFGKIDITNTRIGNPTEGGGPDITSRLSTISTNVTTVSTNVSGLPTFISTYSTTLDHLNSALRHGTVCYNYDTSSGNRGYQNTSAYEYWGVTCFHWGDNPA